MNIAIIGTQCAGKTTAAEFFKDIYGYSIVKFAAPLYSINDAIGVGKNRAFMQESSDLVKNHFGVELFALKFLEKYGGVNGLICDDVRYPLEFVMLKAMGWEMVSIAADTPTRHSRAKMLGLDFFENHSSEDSGPHLVELCDYSLVNNTDLDNLRADVDLLSTTLLTTYSICKKRGFHPDGSPSF